MEKGYFAAAWGDVTKSPGWASVVLRLGLLCLIPIFGVVVMYGYLFSWARDIAWNVHRPLPRKIFANEDGSLYRRGFFIFVVALVFSLVPELVNLFIGMSAGFSFGGTALYGSYVPALFGSMIWLAGNSASLALSFLAALFFWVGAMRVSLYGTLSSGFQIQKIWVMMKHDFIGLLRIVGMAILVAVAIAFSAMVLALFFVLRRFDLADVEWFVDIHGRRCPDRSFECCVSCVATICLRTSKCVGVSCAGLLDPSIRCEPLERPG